jgi:hypothetical protein
VQVAAVVADVPLHQVVRYVLSKRDKLLPGHCCTTPGPRRQ